MGDLKSKIRNAIEDYDPTLARKLVEEALSKNMPVLEIVNEISAALQVIGNEYEEGNFFLTDLVGAASAVEEAMVPIKTAMERSSEEIPYKGTIVMGTVEGDIHSIGKNIVNSLLRANGYEVIDVGEDQPTSVFINAVKEHDADVIGASALLRTTMMQQKVLMEELEKEGLRDMIKAIIGGAPVTREWCEEIGADGYAREAIHAVKLVDRLLAE